MGSFTRLWMTSLAPEFTPTNLRGTWTHTNGVTRLIDPVLPQLLSTNLSVGISTSGVNSAGMLYRGVSGPLAAQTFGGTMWVGAAVVENNNAADMVYHIHAYVTEGDTDTVRGTLLSDYVETLANEWPGGGTTSAVGRISVAQSVSAVAAQAGDRLVVEIGFTQLGGSVRVGTLWYGTELSLDPMVHNGARLLSPFVEFSDAVSTPEDIVDRMSQLVPEAINAGSEAIRMSQLAPEAISGDPQVIRMSQLVPEAISGDPQITRMSQLCIEVISPNVNLRRHRDVFIVT